MKNPDREIVYEAVSQYVAHGTDIEQYICGCQDIRKFLTVRTVKGGGVWCHQYLGKAIRFYHSSAVPHDMCIHYVTNNNRVPNSEGCRPMMDMFPSLPDDVNYGYYIAAAKELLLEIGCA
jgi:hypothetical protein